MIFLEQMYLNSLILKRIISLIFTSFICIFVGQNQILAQKTKYEIKRDSIKKEAEKIEKLKKSNVISEAIFDLGRIKLNEGWKYNIGDVKNGQNLEIDDKNWPTSNINNDINYFNPKGVNQIIWFRKMVNVDGSMVNKSLALSIWTIENCEIYLNGKLIIKSGINYRNEKFRLFSTKNLPYDFRFTQTGPNLISIKYNSSANFAIKGAAEISTVGIVLFKKGIEYYDTFFFNNLNRSFNGILSGMFLIFALLNFTLYYFFRDLRYNLIFGLAHLLFAFDSFYDSTYTFTGSVNGYFITKTVFYFVFYLAFCLFVLGVHRYLKMTLSPITYAVFALVLITKSVFYFFPNYDSWSILCYFLLIAYMVWLVKKAKKQGVPEAVQLDKGFNFLLFSFIGIFFLGILIVIISESKKNSTELFGGSFAILSQSGFQLIVSFSIIFEFLKNYIQNTKTLEFQLADIEQLSSEKEQILSQQNEVLEQKVNQRTQELNKSIEELKAAQTQLIQTEKLASLGELTAGIAHEIQNPLNFVNNFAEVSTEILADLKNELENERFGEVINLSNDLSTNLEKIQFHGTRASGIVKGMLAHSRNQSNQLELTDINQLADEYLRLAYHGLRAKDKSFNSKMKIELAENLPKINIIRQDVGRVILNLITNAFYAVSEKYKKEGSPFEPEVTVTTTYENEKIVIKVQDNGNGIPAKILDKIFQPFFTTKPTGMGTGLGLSMSYEIITKNHKGEILVNTKEGQGSEFTVILPAKT